MSWRYSLLAGILALSSCDREKAFHAQLKLLPDFEVQQIQPDSLAMLLERKEQPLLLDIRTRKEWSVSRLPGAQVVEVTGFDASLMDSVSRDTPIYLYCSVGYRSGEAGKKLKESGFKEVYNLYGGILEWKNRGYTLLTPEGEPTEQVHTYNSYWNTFLEKGEGVY